MMNMDWSEKIIWLDKDESQAKDIIENYETYIEANYGDKIKMIDKQIYYEDSPIDLNLQTEKIAQHIFRDLYIKKKTYIKLVIKSIAKKHLTITNKLTKTDGCLENERDILNNISEIIKNDNSIPENDWDIYKSWREDDAIWDVNKDGIRTGISDCLANIIGFLEHFPKTKNKIKFNNTRNIVEYEDRQVTDNDYHTFINYINKYFLQKFSKLKMIKDAVDNIGNKYKYNPWVNYFDKLEYKDNGTDYIDYTIKNVLCCEEQETYYDLYYETIKIMGLAVMSRIYNKEIYHIPTKYDIVVTYCGRNGGSGKTTFNDRLFDIEGNGNTYCYTVSGDSFQPNNKDFIERSHQCVCLLLDELSMKRAKVTSVKGYITQKDDRFRKAYGYNNEGYFREFIIVATSNNDDILKDYTTANERRWAIIKVSENPKNYENVNKAFDNGFRDKFWGFIKHLYETKDFKLYMDDERLIKLEEKIQRDYKASNNEDYNTIIHDLLERDYGFYDDINIDVDCIVNQYKYNDSYSWCIQHNREVEIKEGKSLKGEYIMKPEDRKIMYWGKIDRIQKTTLYNILNKLGLEFTKPSLAAEMRDSGIWNGYDNKPCKINKKTTMAYWRVEKATRNIVDFNPDDGKQSILPF